MKSFKEFVTSSSKELVESDDYFSMTKHVDDYMQKHRHITATVDNRYGNQRKAHRALSAKFKKTLTDRGYSEGQANKAWYDAHEMMKLDHDE